MSRTIRSTFDGIDHQDADAFLAGLTPDVTFTFGNYPPAHGRDEVRAAVEGFWTTIGGLRHDVQDMWDPEPDVTVVWILVEYTRLDGQVVTVPCIDLLRWDGDLVADWRIVIDLAPVYAPGVESATV